MFFSLLELLLVPGCWVPGRLCSFKCKCLNGEGYLGPFIYPPFQPPGSPGCCCCCPWLNIVQSIPPTVPPALCWSDPPFWSSRRLRAFIHVLANGQSSHRYIILLILQHKAIYRDRHRGMLTDWLSSWLRPRSLTIYSSSAILFRENSSSVHYSNRYTCTCMYVCGWIDIVYAMMCKVYPSTQCMYVWVWV